MKRKIGEILASLREERGLSQHDVARMLRDQDINVSNQAISKWENGYTMPNADQFLMLCKLYEVKDVLHSFLGDFVKYPIERLNREGKQKVDEYIELLLASGLYSLDRKAEKVQVLRSLPLYDIAVSAGTGQFLDSSNYETVEVGSEVPMEGNFGVRISGDSMEPRFIDGQIVWVRQQQTLNNGEIGIFLLDGNAFCKKLYKDEDKAKLISLNSKYAPIEIKGDVRVLGKVVG